MALQETLPRQVQLNLCSVGSCSACISLGNVAQPVQLRSAQTWTAFILLKRTMALHILSHQLLINTEFTTSPRTEIRTWPKLLCGQVHFKRSFNLFLFCKNQSKLKLTCCLGIDAEMRMPALLLSSLSSFQMWLPSRDSSALASHLCRIF